MAWTAAARAAAAEARRRSRNTRGAQAYYRHEGGTKGRGGHAFSLKTSKGAKHTVFMNGKYSDAKNRVMQLAKRVSARRRAMVSVAHLG